MHPNQHDDLIEAVTAAVSQRLRSHDTSQDALIKLVANEVAAVINAEATKHAPTTTEAARTTRGQFKTALGSVINEPSDGRRSLSVCAGCVQQQRQQTHGRRAVVTASGRNQRAVLASLAGKIAELGGDVEDVSQTIVAEFFTLIMIVNVDSMSIRLGDLRDKLQEVAQAQQIHVVVMQENVMMALQRV